MLCQWRDSSTNWVALKGMKQSYPVQVAENAVANRIDDEPAFAWWVKHVIKKRDRILSKITSKYWSNGREGTNTKSESPRPWNKR